MTTNRAFLLTSTAIILATTASFSAADQAQTEPSGVMKTTATASSRSWTKHDEIELQVDLVGGLAATAYSVGPFKADPITVGDKKIEPEKPFGLGNFKVIDRSRIGIHSEHPKDGVRVKIEYKVPKGTKSIGKVTGSVKVLAGGTAKEVVLKNLLTRPEGAIDDPLLTARGLEVDFKRKTLEEGGLQFEATMARDAKGFVRLELVDADGKPIERVGKGSYSGAKGMTYLVTTNKDKLKSATLKLHFRDGGKEIDLPFTVKTVEMTK